MLRKYIVFAKITDMTDLIDSKILNNGKADVTAATVDTDMIGCLAMATALLCDYELMDKRVIRKMS